MISDFKMAVEESQTIEELKECFPLKLIEPKANVTIFYKYYNV